MEYRDIQHPMKIVQLKIRGLGPAPQTDWIPLDPALNALYFSNQASARRLLQAVQAVNPPYDCEDVQPFADYPLLEKRNGYTRHIAAKRRTVAICVFDSPASLVRKLGEITPLLYETERIEVGRRLDYSRWINFVEIASSTRWSEIAADIKRLLGRWPAHAEGSGPLHQLLSTLKNTDRVKDETARILQNWLTGLKQLHPDQPEIDKMLEMVDRAERFLDGKKLVEEKLPLFAVLDPYEISHSPSFAELTGYITQQGSRFRQVDRDQAASLFPEWQMDGIKQQQTIFLNEPATHQNWTGLSTIERLILLSSAIISDARQHHRALPVFLLDLFRLPADVTREELARFLGSLADKCQCLCILDHTSSALATIEAHRISLEDCIKENGHVG